MRYYLVPVVGDGLNGDKRRPKYFADFDGNGALVLHVARGFQAMDCGQEPVMIVAADPTPEEHAAIATQSDVIAFPADLSQRLLEMDVAWLRDRLEALNLPGSNLLSAGLRWRVIARWLTKLFTFHQRYQGRSLGARLLQGKTLGDTVGATMAAQLRLCSNSLGISDPPGLAGLTVRQALKFYADQLPGSAMAGDL